MPRAESAVRRRDTLDSVKQAGPINLLDGNTVLEDRVSKIDVFIDNSVKWTYTLGYQPSVTGKTLLANVQRGGDAPETTTFTYSGQTSASAPHFVLQPALDTPVPTYTNNSNSQESVEWFAPQRDTPVSAVQAPGFRAGTKFIDLDGNGTTDSVYHAGGIGTTATHLLWEESSLQAPSFGVLGGWSVPALGGSAEGSLQPGTGLPYFPRFGSWDRSDFSSATIQDLVDLDGDGDADGVALPMSVKVRPGSGVGFFDPPAPHVDLPPYGQTRLRIFTNTARSGGAQYASEQILDNWPTSALIASTVFATKDTQRPEALIKYNARPDSDLQIPFVDLNADGKSDVVLLRHRAAVRNWNPGSAFAVPRRTMLRLWQNMAAPDLGELVQGPLDALVQSTVRNDHALVLVDDDLLRMVAEPVEYVRLWTTAERLKIVELPGTTPMMVLSAPGGIPAPGVPTNGPLPPPVWDGNPQIPVPLGTGPERPWWTYQVDPEGDVYNPLKDVDRAGGGGPGENFLFGEYRFVPRAYLMRGEAARGLVSETTENASDFERSLQTLLNNGSADECVTTASCQYPPHVSFNSYFADVNGDGLPDLVSAEPPTPSNPPEAGPTLTCFNGHRVHLNRGYAFEDAPFQTVPSDKASWTPADATSALRLVANRDRSCEVTKPRIVDDPLGWPPLGVPPAFPVGAMTQTDINGDGRVDIVLAYKSITATNADQRVFLNTGRGFAPTSAIPLPPTVAIATDMPFPGQNTYGGWPRVAMGDQSRFVDLDNDGLVDIVVAGLCTPLNFNGRTCTSTVWYRNEGTLPDRLERIDSPTGAWTTVECESPKSSIVHIPDGGFHPPATMRVVTKVRSGAGPEATPSGSDPFAVQEIRLSYDNFVKDVVSNEVLGFEKVIAEFVNSFDAAERERVLVTRIFDVQPEIVGASGSPLPVRHPLKGALLSTVTESGGWSTTELYQYQVAQLGSGPHSLAPRDPRRHEPVAVDGVDGRGDAGVRFLWQPDVACRWQLGRRDDRPCRTAPHDGAGVRESHRRAVDDRARHARAEAGLQRRHRRQRRSRPCPRGRGQYV